MVAIMTLIEPGDEIVYMMPNYLQIYGFARGLGVKVLCSRRSKESKGADFIFNTEKELPNEISFTSSALWNEDKQMSDVKSKGKSHSKS